ncbi:MAG: hypothetical protein O3C57_03100, partial [Verrucomicrobia bacterium]|nr:hypothetical protein [Verrucomicrobiota bacterium]
MTCDDFRNALLNGGQSHDIQTKSHLESCPSCERFAATHVLLRSRGDRERAADLSGFQQAATRTAAVAWLQTPRGVERTSTTSRIFVLRRARLGLGLAAALLLVALATRVMNGLGKENVIAISPQRATESVSGGTSPSSLPVSADGDDQLVAREFFPPLPIDWPPPKVEKQIVASRESLNFEVEKFRQHYQSSLPHTFEHRTEQLTVRIQGIAAGVNAELEELDKATGVHHRLLRKIDIEMGIVKKKEERHDAVATRAAGHCRDHIMFSH